MDSIREFEARNLETAINDAEQTLGTNREDLQYDVLCHGSSGIFGLVGARKAKIRVHLPAAQEKPEKRLSKKTPARQPEKDGSDATARAGNGQQLLEKILAVTSADASIQTRNGDGVLHYDIDAPDTDTGILIGKHGQTLAAIQHIVEKAVNRNGGDWQRVEVDVGDYNRKRQLQIEQRADKAARKVTRTGKAVSIGLLTPNERRIAHLALQENRSVRSVSVGKGFERKLLVVPQRDERDTRRNTVNRNKVPAA